MACYFDLKSRRIPNAISVTTLASGLVFHLTTAGGTGLLHSLAGFATGFGILLVLYVLGASGAGDVKFFGAVGAWVGPYHILFVFVLSAILLGLFALLVVCYRAIFGSKGPAIRDVESEKTRVESPWKAQIPFAVPLTAAILLRLFWLIAIHRIS